MQTNLMNFFKKNLLSVENCWLKLLQEERLLKKQEFVCIDLSVTSPIIGSFRARKSREKVTIRWTRECKVFQREKLLNGTMNVKARPAFVQKHEFDYRFMWKFIKLCAIFESSRFQNKDQGLFFVIPPRAEIGCLLSLMKKIKPTPFGNYDFISQRCQN